MRNDHLIMYVERGHFLLLVSTLAAGGAGGYLASEKNVVPHMAGGAHDPAPTKVAELPPLPAPTSVTVVTSAEAQRTAAEADRADKAAQKAAAKAACDDSVGEPDACPAVGLPTEEGGCGALAAMRCADFKKTMKPRVAAAAVSCLKKLSGGERCDPKRIELCAHVALMNACDDSTSESVIKSCDAVASTCTGTSKNECLMAISGLRETGREAMVDCAKKHCSDKGILGCEAIGPNAKQ